MDFEILGEITEITRIARGPGIRDIAKLRQKYGRGRWRKLTVSQRYVFGMDAFGLQNYTGMKRTGLDVRT